MDVNYVAPVGAWDVIAASDCSHSAELRQVADVPYILET